MSARRQTAVGTSTVEALTLSPPGRLARWLPAAAVIVLGCATIALSRAIDERLVKSRIERTTLEATLLSDEIGLVLDAAGKSFARVARRVGDGTYGSEASWQRDVREYLADVNNPDAAVRVFGPGFLARWTIDGVGPSPDLALGLASATVEARELGHTAVMRPTETQPGFWTFRLAAPIPDGGVVAANLSIPALLEPLLHHSPYALTLEADGEVVYRRGTPSPEARLITRPVPVPGATWRVHVAPSAAQVAQARSPLGSVLLIVGLLLSGAVGWGLVLNRRSTERAERIRESALALEREVAARARAEEDLRATTALQRAILQHANSIIVSIDLQGRVQSFNRTAERLLGYRAEEMIGRALPEIFDADEVAARAHALSQVLERPVAPGLDVFVATLEPGQPTRSDWTHVARDGRRFPAEMSLDAILDAEGVVTGYVAVSTDITERRHADLLRRWAEESLRRAEELLHNVLDASSNGIVATRTHRGADGAIDDFEVLLVNPAAERLLERGASSLVGRMLRQEMGGDTDGSIFAALVRTAESRQPAEFETRYVRDELDLWVRVSLAPIADGVAVTFEDISLRKRAEEDAAEYIAELERSRDQIHQQSVLLQWQADELIKARDEALAGAREMETALKMQADFVSFASHQLRTPLAGIKWLLELAIEEPDAEGELRSYLVDSLTSAERLISLVNDLLDVARLEGGRAIAAPARVDLGALCRDLIAQLTPNLEQRGHALATSGLDADHPVFADGAMLQQAIQNLLSNAIKYTPDGGRLQLHVTRREDAVDLMVEDNGLGVPEAARPRLFEKFFRADNVQTVETEGTGLGLFMVRLILEKFGGRLWYEPGTGGLGSRFLFSLPVLREGVDGEASPDRGGRPRAATRV
jgi:PAS domain S-box-containing protein